MIKIKKSVLSHFSNAQSSESLCSRPENEQSILDYPTPNLARGAGLSYSDCCFNSNAYIIDTTNLNHLIHFDRSNQILECQAAVRFADLFKLDSEFIPPVVPGTLHATIAGGIANDVHGKNNHKLASLGKHIVWIDLVIGKNTIRCSAKEHSELFYASIGGLGLTGVITRVGLRMHKASHWVEVKNRKYCSITDLTEFMTSKGLHYDYQVAWLDLLNEPTNSVLSLANHCQGRPKKAQQIHTVPKLPFSLIYNWNMRLFNKMYFSQVRPHQCTSIQQFTNPLDCLNHWNRLYGPKGLIQIQALFNTNKAPEMIKQIQLIIKKHRATPALAVLKLFTQTGMGLLSFCEPGFTLAIDFPYNKHSVSAVQTLNQFISDAGGKVYLAKDLVLQQEQFARMYPKQQQFKHIIKQYASGMQSDLAKRLGLSE